MLSDQLIVTIASASGGSGALVLLAWLLGKLLDKYKPTHERRKDEAESHAHEVDRLQDQIEYWQKQVTGLQARLDQIDHEVRALAQERHRFYSAIIRCTVEHPSTAQWWQSQIKELRKQ